MSFLYFLIKNVIADELDVASTSGRSVSFTDEMEMEDKKPAFRRNDDENESDDDSSVGVQFTATVTKSSDENICADESHEKKVVKVKKTVQMIDNPITHFDDHSDSNLQHEHHPNKHESPFQEFGKMFFLIFIWFLMIAFLASTEEKKIEKRQMVLPKNEPKIYNMTQPPNGTLIHITLQAPFLPDPKEYPRKMSNQSIDTRNKDNTLVIFLRKITGEVLTPNKTFYIYKPLEIDLKNATKIDFNLDIGEDNFYALNEHDIVQVVILSNFSKSSESEIPETPIILSVDFFPINKPIGVLFATFTLILLYALIVWEVREKMIA